MHLSTEERETAMVQMTVTSRNDNPHTTSFENQLLWSGVKFCEEFILPEQFYPPVRVQDKYRGEVALLYAILGDAIRCFLEERRKQRQDRGRAAREAETWLFVDDESWPFSFLNICELLDLNPTSVRLHLKRWQQSSARQRTSSPCFDPQTFIDESRTHADRSVLLPRCRKRCIPVRQLHGKETG